MFNISQAGLRRYGAVLGLSMLVASSSWGIAGGGAVAQESECWTSAPSMDLGYPQWSEAPQMVIDTSKTYTATLETNRGDIEIELADEEAPNTVNNYVCLARAGYYDVTIFHRIIANFMIQGGDPTGTGTSGPGYQVGDELPEGDAPYVRGTLAMANAGPNTNGSQFFIVQQDQSEQFPLNYSIFGHVTEGLEVLDTIADVPVGPNKQQTETSSPLATLGIKTITILEDGEPLTNQAGTDATAVAPTLPATSSPATEAATATEAAVSDSGSDDNNLPLWIAGGIAVLAAAGFAYYRGVRRKTD